MKMIYVVYSQDDGEHTEMIRSSSAGQAFSQIMEKYPDAKLIKAYCEGGFRDGFGYTEWLAPSLAKPEPLPSEKLEQTKMKL